MVIVVERKPDYVLAYPKDIPAIQATGKSMAEAIGKLIVVDPQAYGFEVEKDQQSFERYKRPLT